MKTTLFDVFLLRSSLIPIASLRLRHQQVTEPGLDEAREAPGTKCKEALALRVMQVLTVPLQDAKSRCLLKCCALSVCLALARTATSATRARTLPIPRDCEN